ncbi:hypothetical protein CAC42_2853 [Sphaceloma murrayae]|uniref:Calcineurin-like phosphoesterase domain-containing protein n=1 Tax=Sphaceloma murrayae TaxID=2082308 RepID=A0A2K1R0U4_9PEZI|nr:hypothetical protein CAC42_2853 [Sphaceloma murrayae]
MARSALHKQWDDLQPYIQLILRNGRRFKYRAVSASRDLTLSSFVRRYIFRAQTILILLWIWVIHWGEVRVYQRDIRGCHWDKWERWPQTATPHRVAFIADPQLIDPHTYPGRPWPLSSLTIAFTDKYLKRSYHHIQRSFDPDTVYFLGDLFDGGREWSTGEKTFHASEKQWKRYGPKYWRKEFERFGKLFLTSSQVTGGRSERAEKNIIASLPGNHDLGFATGVQTTVRDRFQAYFGKGDRVDIIGNHTFVGLDTVSLSAMDVHGSDPKLWQPSMEFLDEVKVRKRLAVDHFLGRTPDYPRGWKFFHKTTNDPEDRLLIKPKHDNFDEVKKAGELPTILLTHVPFYREPGTPCGPLREKYPPSVPRLEVDERNAIRVAAGYQYQNVLSKGLSKTIADRIGNIGYIFSGDDHDYCELVHRAYTSAGSGIKEITVKSISWAMGVRRPGFQMVSLWNPVNEYADPLPGSPQAIRMPTLQTHLCLMPNQLGIFIQYAFYFGLTLVTLLIHSVIITMRERNKPIWTPIDSVLPVSEPEKTHLKKDKARSRASSGSGNGSSSSEGNGFLVARSDNARARSVSPGTGAIGNYGLPPAVELKGVPLIHKAGFYGPKRDDEDSWIDDLDFEMKPIHKRRRGFAMHFLEIFRKDMLWVAGPAFAWFLWLWRIY